MEEMEDGMERERDRIIGGWWWVGERYLTSIIIHRRRRGRPVVCGATVRGRTAAWWCCWTPLQPCRRSRGNWRWARVCSSVALGKHRTSLSTSRCTGTDSLPSGGRGRRMDACYSCRSSHQFRTYAASSLSRGHRTDSHWSSPSAPDSARG